MNGILNKTTLIAALAVQMAIVGVLLAVASGSQVEAEPFLTFDARAVDGLSVAGEDGEVTLTKAASGWQLPDGLPVDETKVDGVIEKLADAAAGWPVATSASVQERFEVAEDNHQRRLTLSGGGEPVADIYLGTSPGYRKAHARRVDDDDIYAITFSNYEAGTKAADWLDKALLRPNGALTGMRYDGAFDLSKDEEGVWTASTGAALDQAKVETLAGRFTGLTVTGVSELSPQEAIAEQAAEDAAAQAEAAAEAAEDAGEDAVADAAADAAADAVEEAQDEPKTPASMVFALADEDGVQTLTIHRIDHRIDANDFLATSDRVAGTYKVSSYIAEQMHKALADLAPDEPVEVDSQVTGEEAETANATSEAVPPTNDDEAES